ncbi:MAG: ribosome biogenesis GTPase Der, partial [Nitrospira sp.]
MLPSRTMSRTKQTRGPVAPLFTLEGGRLPIIALIGRPNVGKSTLFNRILGTRAAIVDDVPGVTRDRNYADSTYRNRRFRLVDTGGLDPTASDGMLSLIRQQSQLAIAEADILVLVLDARSGLTPADEEVVQTLRGSDKPVYYVINKIDTPKADPLVADFYRLGQEQLYPLSAEHGIGVAELLDDLFSHMAEPLDEEATSDTPRIAIVGRPNVGKSTLVNSVLGEARVVVSNVPGTTRDPVDSVATFKDRQYVLTDTAGIRRRGRVERGIEGYSVARSLRAIGRSDIAVLLLDAEEGVTEQDTKIAGLVL